MIYTDVNHMAASGIVAIVYFAFEFTLNGT